MDSTVSRICSCCMLTALLLLCPGSAQKSKQTGDTFKTELFLNGDDLDSGLYEGEVRGRRLFGGSQIPHGWGTIYYFTTDKYNRQNYTGDWVNGTREGNGTTFWRDGSIYSGEYRNGLEDGFGNIRYPNGNTLDATFEQGKIQGHGVFRYANGDQREGIFTDNILSGQVIFTRANGTTILEEWDNGKRIEAKKETTPNEHAEERTETRRPDNAPTRRPDNTNVKGDDDSATTAAEPAVERPVDTPSDHGHGGVEVSDHELDADLGDLPTLWYSETHQIQTDDNLTPNQDITSSTFEAFDNALRQAHDAGETEHNPALNRINLKHVLDIVKKWDDSRIKVDRRGRRVDTDSGAKSERRFLIDF